MADPATPRRRFWGWGWEGAGPSPEQQEGIRGAMASRFPGAALELVPEPRIDDVTLPAPRVEPPDVLRALCSEDPLERAGHTYGKSYRDSVRGVRRDFASPPDQVAYPQNENDVRAVLDWCGDQRIAAIPYGGGSSVVGGVETAVEGDYRGVVSIDLSRLDRVLEIDRTSRAARIEAGIYGPALEDALRPHGLTLRHFPQSFEFSTLGGWIATRSGGHYATLYTHIDDFVESLRVVTPQGTLESRRLPGSGAGPSPDRLFVGSEGSLGIITEAWMRLQDRPTFRTSTSVRFVGDDGFLRGADAVRALSQSGLAPANCRLLDPGEAQTSGAGDGRTTILVLGFESADHSLDAWMERALELCRDAGGEVPEGAGRTQQSSGGSGEGGAQREGAAGAWRRAFLQAPYLRDVLVRMSVICETFETAITWDRFPDFHASVTAAVEDALARVCGAGTLQCRFTHAYPDGAAPYYSVMAPGRKGSELEQWAEIKAAASEALIAHGGTITHHHSVGRDHRPWYDRQRPDLFARALAAAKHELDPAGVMNPGVVLDAAPTGD
ncbi:MAG: FAD-binding oxidoreductase [Deltaproteobacteria bacterium]|nr:FAD-binding oxidoreductase [Deltaproteobacteria bacterium]MBW2382568.1 FAD-binding oxidoreductase [Deltaproteobacteria bacterium]